MSGFSFKLVCKDCPFVTRDYEVACEHSADKRHDLLLRRVEL